MGRIHGFELLLQSTENICQAPHVWFELLFRSIAVMKCDETLRYRRFQDQNFGLKNFVKKGSASYGGKSMSKGHQKQVDFSAIGFPKIHRFGWDFFFVQFLKRQNAAESNTFDVKENKKIYHLIFT